MSKIFFEPEMDLSIKKKNHQVVFVVGSTASGKSHLALEWAQKFSGIIVNCDSVQTFKGLEIGSAQPSPLEKAIVPHHLYAYLDKGAEITAGQYRRHFFDLLKSLPDKQRVLVVGGTGFYFQAIEKGMYPVPEASEEIKNEIKKMLESADGPSVLYQELLAKDPESARQISVNDHYRIGRAMEVMRSQGKTLSAIKKEFAEIQIKNPCPFNLLKIGTRWSREDLLIRVQKRTAMMLKLGLVDEVRGLLTEGLESWSPLKSVGYHETVDYLRNMSNSSSHEDLSLLEQEIVMSTMRLAKKQRTWFQRDPEIKWYQPEKSDLENETICQQVQSHFETI